MRTGRMLVLAVFGTLPVAALGQYQIENSTGRLLDANNRLGSAGMNDRGQTTGGYSADDIVYGNVTRGRQFRGALTTTDARAFRADLTTPSDNLTRDAGPSVYERGGISAQFTGQRYYGDNRGVRPPEGFRQLTPGSVGAFQVVQPTFRVPGDIRMDDTIPNPDMSLPRPAQYITPGISETESGTEGMRTNRPQGLEGELMPSRDLLRRLNLDEMRIREMRDELRQTTEEPGGEQTPRDPNDLTIAPETPVNDRLSSDLRNDVTAQAISGSLNTQQSIRQQLLTADTASRQSSQYAELRMRLDRFRKRQTMTDEEASRDFQREWMAAQEREKEARLKEQTARVLTPQTEQKPEEPAKLPDATEEETGLDRGDRARIAMRQQQLEGQEKVEGILPPQPDIPLKIASFAEGVKATGLKNLLTDAEKAMQAGRFTQALDYYDGAAAVAPNNPLIMVGRAVAELGAGYYARAQIHLEQALSLDPALLMARYDLKTFYGEDRLAYIVRDLKDLAQAETRQARPLFLLAFIAYSTENEQRAADYLNMAEQRGGSKEFYDKLREYWKLNEKKKDVEAAPAGAAVPGESNK